MRRNHIRVPTRLLSFFDIHTFIKCGMLVTCGAGYVIPAPEEGVAALNPLKQCLCFDPDEVCLLLHRYPKAFAKSFVKLNDLLGKEDWRGILTESRKGKEKELLKRFDEAMKANTLRERLLAPPSKKYAKHGKEQVSSSESLEGLSSKTDSYSFVVSCLYKLGFGVVRFDVSEQGQCLLLRTFGSDDCADDVDGLVGESLMTSDEDSDAKETVQLFEKAFEASGRSSRDIHKWLNDAKKAIEMRMRKAITRKAAKSAHPDKGGTEQKMAALRAWFDTGDVPNDPSGGDAGPFTYTYSGGYGGFGGFPGGDYPFAQFFRQSGGGDKYLSSSSIGFCY
ncbi:hypothetical protein L218DRAFT_1082019 [Marasmius fiardii PR-910]|nr:hypothetical protein L218DRAFT_1082019 [Marasmius fiardii PR-910]